MPSFDLAAWPPPGAEPADAAGIYDVLAGRGLGYGPAFRGLVAAWRRGQEVFAEAALPEAVPADSYGLHPALLDAALHAIGLGSFAGTGGDGPVLPFAFTGVALHAAGAAAVRVRLAPAAGGIAVQLADAAGMPVASVQSLAIRPADQAALTAAGGGQQWLFSVDWQPHEVAAVPGGPGPGVVVLGEDGLAGLPEAPAVVVVACPAPDGPVPAAVRTAVDEVLGLVQAWLGDDRFAGSQLVIVTRGAVAARAGESVADLAGAAVWGLAASAQAEHPGQVMLADTDTGLDERVLALIAAAAGDGEPRLAIRGGQVLVPRLARTARAEPGHEPLPLAPKGSVLVTGGTGALGALTARHLVTAHNIRHLILASRRGGAAPGAAALAADLAGRGARVTVAACDVGERQALEDLLASIPAEHALTGVVHAAGVLDDALVGSLTPERVDVVLAAKADGSWYLHELTQDLGLGMFVLFSSAAGVLGSPGQGNYAAASTFLDALACYRRTRGLAATSLAWGLWSEYSEMVGQANSVRVGRQGMRGLSAAEGLDLLDAGLTCGEPALVAARLDTAWLARSETVPPLLSGLVRRRGRRAAADGTVGDGGLAGRLAGLSDADRAAAVLDLVRGHIAATLGHASPQAVEPGRAFRDLGFDSLTAVELRNRLGVVTGLRLPATAVFDYPTPEALSGYLLSRLAGGPAAAGRPVVPMAASTSDDPVVIVGMSCRFPGAESPQRFWDLVAGGRDAVAQFPADRGWDVESLYDPEPGLAGKSYTAQGAFLADAAGFDAGFFGISPREALAMDPQQRLLLEACWAALEDAGIDPATLRGTPAGVFAGIMYNDYAAPLQATAEDLAGLRDHGHVRTAWCPAGWRTCSGWRARR